MEDGYPCSRCGVVFNSSIDRGAHTRDVCQPSFKLKMKDGNMLTITRSEDGQFHCSSVTCSYSSRRAETLRHHFFSTHAPKEENKEIGLDVTESEEGFCTSPDQSMTPSILSQANLCIVEHENLVLLICLTCHTAIQSVKGKSILTHVKGHGLHLENGLIEDELDRSLAGFSFTDEHDPLLNPYTRVAQSNLLPPIPGIIIRSGFACTICPYYCGKRKSIAKHRREDHNGLVFEDMMSPCHVQKLSNNVSRIFYGVEKEDSYASEADAECRSLREILVSQYKEHLITLEAEAIPPVAELTAWLRVSRWHELADQFMPKEVPFVEVKGEMLCPSQCEKSGILSRVCTLVSMYMRRGQVLIRTEVEYRLRRMVEMTNENMEVTVGFGPLDRETTCTRYSEFMTSFLLCLLRSSVGDTMHEVGVNQVIFIKEVELRHALQQLMIQLQSFEDGSVVEEADLTIIHSVLLHLWTPHIPAKLEAKRATDCMTTRFLILDSLQKIGMDPNSKGYGFEDVSNLTQRIAILKYWVKLVVLMELAQKLWNQKYRSLSLGEVDHLLLYVRDQALPTPFCVLCETTRLASTVTYNMPRRPRLIPINDDLTACEFDGQTISLDMMRKMVQAIMVEAETIMKDEVLFGLQTGWVDNLLKKKGRIVDNLNCDKSGYSFLTDVRNESFEEHRLDLLFFLFQRQKMKAHFIEGVSNDKKVVWKKKALRQWMVACSKVQNLFTLLVHFVAGLPARGEEYGSLLVRKTGTGERAFYWSHNTIMVYSNYHKSYNCGSPMKLIAKFLPHCMRSMFLKYLCMVRPVQSFVAGILWGKKVANLYQDCWFVNMDSRAAGHDLSRSVRGAFQRHCNLPFGIADYRHIAAFFSHNIREQHPLHVDDLVDLQGGHGSATVGRNYAQSAKDLRFIDDNLMRGFELISEKWHKLMGVNGKEEELPTYRSPSNTIVITPGQDVEVETIPYSRKRTRIVDCSDEVVETFKPSQGDPLCHVSQSSSTQACVALRKLGHLDWRSMEQATAVACSMDNSQNFVAVLPTGMGKSVIFMAPSQVMDKTVIVIVPLMVLVEGHVHECKKAGIECTVYNEDNIAFGSPPPIVFVQVENAAKSNQLLMFAKHLQNSGRLHSIVFDEIHLLLSDFRPAMFQMLHLMTLQCQVIGLTTSLSPTREREVERMLATQLLWIRSHTVRPNIHYRIVEAHDIKVEIIRKLSTWISSAREEDRAIVYCMSRKEVEDMARELHENSLPCTYMHAGVEREERMEELNCWEGGEQKILVATGVISCGYNYKSVRLVLHVGSTRSGEQYHQEFGRSGRDGLLAESCIVTNKEYRKKALDKYSDLDAVHKWMEDDEKCRRLWLHKEVDGKSQLCALIPNAKMCDVCSKEKYTSCSTVEVEVEYRKATISNPSCSAMDVEYCEAAISNPTCSAMEVEYYGKAVISSPMEIDVVQMGSSTGERIGEKRSSTTPDESATPNRRTCTRPLPPTTPIGPWYKASDFSTTNRSSTTTPPGPLYEVSAQSSEHCLEDRESCKDRERPVCEVIGLASAQTGQVCEERVRERVPTGIARVETVKARVETVIARVQPVLIEEKIEGDKNDLWLVQNFVRDGSLCLLCKSAGALGECSNISRCPQLNNRCMKCLGGHWANKCKYSFPHVRSGKGACCWKCYFQCQPILGMTIHEGPYGKECKNGPVGDQLRLFIWSAWREPELRKSLCQIHVEMKGKRDEEFAEWITQVNVGRVINNYIRCAASIVRIQFPELH